MPNDTKNTLDEIGVFVRSADTFIGCECVQLGLPGIREDEFIISGFRCMPYIRIDFCIERQGVPIEIEKDAADDVVCNQMERRMKEDRSWVQLSLFE